VVNSWARKKGGKKRVAHRKRFVQRARFGWPAGKFRLSPTPEEKGGTSGRKKMGFSRGRHGGTIRERNFSPLGLAGEEKGIGRLGRKKRWPPRGKEKKERAVIESSEREFCMKKKGDTRS